MVILYLFRHGRTTLNASGLLRGRIDAPLDEVGREEVTRLGKLFAPVHLDEIVSSPLVRSVDTARAIAEQHGLIVTSDPGFLDRDYGPWAGKAQEDVERRYGSVDAAPVDEIESRDDVTQRVTTSLDRLVSRSDGRTIGLVGHDAVNRALIHSLCGADYDGIPQPTACWNRLIFESGKVTCDVIGALPGDGLTPINTPLGSCG